MSNPTFPPHLEKIRALTPDQVVRYRIGIAGRQAPEWEPWQAGEIFVQKREVELRKALRSHGTHAIWQKGALLTLTPKDSTTAEFSENDYSPEFDTFCVEEYYLQIDWEYNHAQET